MKLEKVKLALYKYKMKSLTITYGKGKKAKKHVVHNSLIIKFDIVESFEKEILPFFTLTLALPNDVYREIIKPATKNNIKVNMKLQKGKFKEALSTETDTTISFRDVINENFHAVIGPKEIELSEAEQKVVEKGANKYGQLSTLTIALYNSSFWNSFQTVVNANLESVTLTDVIVYGLTKAKVKNVLLSPPSNTKVYSQFKLIPVKLHELLTRITDTYAYHDKGSIVYFGIDRAYIIAKEAKCSAYETNENKITYIIASTTNQNARASGGAYVNTQKKYNVLNALEINSDNSSEVTKKTVGSNIVAVDSDGKVTKTNGKATTVTNVVVQKEGDIPAKSLKREITESKKQIKCQFQNEDISMLKPNKQFIVSVEGVKYKKYNGKYRLSLVSHSFEKEGDYFSVSSIAFLKG